FIKIKCVLLCLAVGCDKALIVASLHAAFVAPVAREIKHTPNECAPDVRSRFQFRPGPFMKNALIFLRMPWAIVLGLARILFVLIYVCAGAIFAYAVTTAPAGISVGRPHGIVLG